MVIWTYPEQEDPERILAVLYEFYGKGVSGLVVDWGGDGNRGSTAPPISLESQNTTPTILAPVFSILLLKCLSVTISWQSPHLYTFSSITPGLAEHTWRKTTQPASLMLHNSWCQSSAMLVILLCFCGLHSLLQRPLPPPSFSTKSNVLAQVWIYFFWSSASFLSRDLTLLIVCSLSCVLKLTFSIASSPSMLKYIVFTV